MPKPKKERKPCNGLAKVSCGLGKGHPGECAPYPTEPTEIPSLIPDPDYDRFEITVTPEEKISPRQVCEIASLVHQFILDQYHRMSYGKDVKAMTVYNGEVLK